MSQNVSPIGPRLIDPTWAPPHATVRTVRDAREARMVYRLRYRIYVHEQGKRPEGVNWARSELVDALDRRSQLWYARDDGVVVGALTRTVIGCDFDLGQLPAALELDAFPRSASCPITFSSRFAIAPDHRGTWVMPSLARYAYAHGRELGAKFDVMATNPALVPLFERFGYLRYTASAVVMPGVGLLIPMILPGTDHAHLRSVRSACLPAAAHFPDEPRWGTWLRATRPIIDTYYGSAQRDTQCGATVARHTDLPPRVAAELDAMSFVHHFPAGTTLLHVGDRVTCAFHALDGRLGCTRPTSDTTAARAPDGVAFSRAVVRCETAATVLCTPIASIERLLRRRPEHGDRLRTLLPR